jgi:hypothetical protein
VPLNGETVRHYNVVGNAFGNSVVEQATQLSAARNERKHASENAAAGGDYATGDGREEIVITEQPRAADRRFECAVGGGGHGV